MNAVMKSYHFFIFSILLSAQAFATGATNDLWLELKQDFESKPNFLNANTNDNRTDVMSPFMETLFGEHAYNNAAPLTDLQLEKLPDAKFVGKKPFALAMAGRERLIKAGKINSTSLLAIADFSKNSRKRRFYIIDVEKGEVLLNTWVSHATNSDDDEDGIPELFSNVSGTGKSSAGFMVTGATYNGAYGFSQRLIGLDPVLNSKVLPRAVVIHGFGGLGAQQASWGSVSTSEGCLMFSKNESGLFWGMEDKSMVELVIKTLISGSLIFTYTEVVNAQEQPIIFNSTWIKRSDLPVSEEQ